MKQVILHTAQLIVFVIFTSIVPSDDYKDKPFNDAINTIKKSHDIQSFEEELNNRNPTLMRALATNTVIMRFITRPATSIRFTQDHEPIITSEYEKMVYNTLGKEKLLCRHHALQGTFNTSWINIPERDFLMASLTKQAATSTRNITFCSDLETIYDCRKHIDQDPKKFDNAYYISMICNEIHMATTITKYSSVHTPITFYIDSIHNNVPLYHYFKKRFNLDYTDNVEKTSYIDVADTKKNTGSTWGDELPFLNSSLNLQYNNPASTKKDDNCTLYAYEIAKAAINYLNKNDLTTLTNACNDKKNYINAASIVREGIKRYLPGYYNCVAGTYVITKRSNIEVYNRTARWWMSGEVLKNDLEQYV